jgi:hypothetical protein
VTVTLTDGPGNTNDWLALAAVGAADTSYLQWVNVASGATTATWTVTMPSAPGDYEFRLFEKGGFTRVATSAPVVVSSVEPPPDPDPDPTLPPTLSVSATDVGPGEPVTVTLTDGPGNTNDWLALAAVGAPNTSYWKWVYVASGATTATWTVTMPSAPGDYEFRLFEKGGFTRVATSATVFVGP